MLQDIGFDGISPLIGSDDNVVNVYFNSYFPKAVSPPLGPNLSYLDDMGLATSFAGIVPSADSRSVSQ